MENGAIRCTAEHGGGAMKAKTCWDTEIQCDGKALASASACETVDISEKKEHKFSDSELALPKCSGHGALKVKDMKVTIVE